MEVYGNAMVLFIELKVKLRSTKNLYFVYKMLKPTILHFATDLNILFLTN